MDALGIEDWRKKSFIPILHLFWISKTFWGLQKLKENSEAVETLPFTRRWFRLHLECLANIQFE